MVHETKAGNGERPGDPGVDVDVEAVEVGASPIIDASANQPATSPLPAEIATGIDFDVVYQRLQAKLEELRNRRATHESQPNSQLLHLIQNDAERLEDWCYQHMEYALEAGVNQDPRIIQVKREAEEIKNWAKQELEKVTADKGSQTPEDEDGLNINESAISFLEQELSFVAESAVLINSFMVGELDIEDLVNKLTTLGGSSWSGLVFAPTKNAPVGSGQTVVAMLDFLNKHIERIGYSSQELVAKAILVDSATISVINHRLEAVRGLFKYKEARLFVMSVLEKERLQGVMDRLEKQNGVSTKIDNLDKRALKKIGIEELPSYSFSPDDQKNLSKSLASLRQIINTFNSELVDNSLLSNEELSQLPFIAQLVERMAEFSKKLLETLSSLDTRFWAVSLATTATDFDINNELGCVGFIRRLNHSSLSVNSFPFSFGGKNYPEPPVLLQEINLLIARAENAAQTSVPNHFSDEQKTWCTAHSAHRLSEAREARVKLETLATEFADKKRKDDDDERRAKETEDERLKREKEAVDELDKILRDLTNLDQETKGATYPIQDNSDGVKDVFDPITRRLDGINETLVDATKLNEAREKLSKIVFRAYGYTALSKTDEFTLTNTNTPTILDFKGKVFSGRIIPGMQAIISKAENTYGLISLATDLQKELDDIKERATTNMLLQISANTVWSSLVGQGPDRKIPTGLDDDNFPFGGPLMKKITHSVYKEGVCSQGHNTVVNASQDLHLDDFWKPGVYKTKYEQTATDWCMNRLRLVFDGADPKAVTKSGDRISTRNLHTAEGELIDYVYQELLNHLDGNGLSDKKMAVSKPMVKRAYQAYLMMTQDHCYLASDSVKGLRDAIYYAFHFDVHIAKYEFAGRTDASQMAIHLLFGFKDLETGEVVDALRDFFLTKKELLRLENKLRDMKAIPPANTLLNRVFKKAFGSRDLPLHIQEQLFKVFGRTNLGHLLRPMMIVPNCAKGTAPVYERDPLTQEWVEKKDDEGRVVRRTRRETPTLANYPRSQPLVVNLEKFQRGEISFEGDQDKGELGPVQYKRSGLGERNQTVTLGDLQDVRDGSVPFSFIDWDIYTGDTRELRVYYDSLAKNGEWLVSLLMSSEDKFVETLGNLSKLGGTENTASYVVPLLVKLGAECAAGRKLTHPTESWSTSYSDISTYNLVARLILARAVLVMDDRSSDSLRQDRLDLDRFFEKLARENLFGSVGSTGEDTSLLIIDTLKEIAKAVAGGRKMQELGQTFKKNVRDYHLRH